MKNLSACLASYLIAVSFLLLPSLSSIAQLIPIPINVASLNEDLVADGAGNDPAGVTTTTIGSNYVLYDGTFKTSNPVITAGGLPANGLITNGLDNWQLSPYTANNALFFPVQEIPSSGSLALTGPAKYSRISLLATCAVGSVNVDIALTFSDASTTSYGSFVVNNWVGQVPFVIQGFGAIFRSSPVTVQQGTPDEPRLYQLDINLSSADQLKNVTSIVITNTDVSSTSTAAFFAASGVPVLALPITFSSLSAQYQAAGKKIVLNWEAQTSINSSGFEVQRSAEGSVFATIATINSNKIIGTSKYSYIDNDLQNKQAWFYRIKETLGGTINYSKILNVKTTEAASLKIIQSGGYIHLATNLPDKSYTYKIVDLNGRVLKSGTITSANQFAIDIQNIPTGPYILNILNKTETRSMKFVK